MIIFQIIGLGTVAYWGYKYFMNRDEFIGKKNKKKEERA